MATVLHGEWRKMDKKNLNEHLWWIFLFCSTCSDIRISKLGLTNRLVKQWWNSNSCMVKIAIFDSLAYFEPGKNLNFRGKILVDLWHSISKNNFTIPTGNFRRKIQIHSEAETPFEVIPIASRMSQQKFIAHVPKNTCSLFGARN